jgi:hypothetical protein
MPCGIEHVEHLMTKPWVLLDCDGVLLDWDLAVQQYALEYRSHVWDGIHMDEHSYDLTGRMNISSEDAQQLIHDFHHSQSYAHLPPMTGAVLAISQLSRFANLAVITACGTQDQIVKSRMHNLAQVFGSVFVHVHCTDSFAEKAQHLCKYDPGYWVEDHARNAQMGQLYGHQCFLIDAPHNSHQTVPGVQRVKSVAHAAEIILGILRAKLQISHQNL